MHQKKEKNFQKKMSPHLSQLNLEMAHRNYLGEIICKSSNWQHIQRLKITILGANWHHFWIGKDCQMFIFYFVYPKHQVLLICNENKEISFANLMIQ